MVALISFFSLLRLMLGIFILVLLCFNNFIVYYSVSILIFSIIFLSFLIFPFSRSWKWWESATWSLLLSNISIIVFLILSYAVIFYKIELFQIWNNFREISFPESIYLSIVSWTWLNSYISINNPKVALLIALEWVNWYFYLAFLFAILSYWFSDAIEKNNKYIKQLRHLKLFKNNKWTLTFSGMSRTTKDYPRIALLEWTIFWKKWLESSSQKHNYVVEISLWDTEKLQITADRFNALCIKNTIDFSTDEKIKLFIDSSFRIIWKHYFEWTNF